MYVNVHIVPHVLLSLIRKRPHQRQKMLEHGRAKMLVHSCFPPQTKVSVAAVDERKEAPPMGRATLLTHTLH